MSIVRPVAIIAVAVALSIGSSRAEGPDLVGDHVTITVKAGERVVIGAHALWNMDCPSPGLPQLRRCRP